MLRSVGLGLSGVTPGTYTNATITVDAHGIVTLASNGSGGGGTISGSIAATQVAFGSGTNAIAGSSSLTWDGAKLTVPKIYNSTQVEIESGSGGVYLHDSSSSLIRIDGAGNGYITTTGTINFNTDGSHTNLLLDSDGATFSGGAIFNGIDGLGNNFKVNMTGGNAIVAYETIDGGSCQFQFASMGNNYWSQGMNPGYFGDNRYFLAYNQQTGFQAVTAAETTSYIGIHNSNPQAMLHLGELNGNSGIIKLTEAVGGGEIDFGIYPDDGYAYLNLENTTTPGLTIGAAVNPGTYKLYVMGETLIGGNNLDVAGDGTNPGTLRLWDSANGNYLSWQAGDGSFTTTSDIYTNGFIQGVGGLISDNGLTLTGPLFFVSGGSGGAAGDVAVSTGGTSTPNWKTPVAAGVPQITSGRFTGQTAAKTNITPYTVGAADSSFLVWANVLVTASTLNSFSATCTYTDESNTSRTLTLNFSQLTGAFITTITNATGAAPYEGVPVAIRCKAGSTITLSTTGTFTTVTYNVEGFLQQVR